MSILIAGSGGEGGVKLKLDGNFLPLLERTLRTNRIFSVALVYCEKMSTIAFFGG